MKFLDTTRQEKLVLDQPGKQQHGARPVRRVLPLTIACGRAGGRDALPLRLGFRLMCFRLIFPRIWLHYVL